MDLLFQGDDHEEKEDRANRIDPHGFKRTKPNVHVVWIVDRKASYKESDAGIEVFDEVANHGHEKSVSDNPFPKIDAGHFEDYIFEKEVNLLVDR